MPAGLPKIGQAPVHYERRQPEKTNLYQLVQNHIETFYAQVETETEYGLPAYVKKEFDAFLDCGILGVLPINYSRPLLQIVLDHHPHQTHL